MRQLASLRLLGNSLGDGPGGPALYPPNGTSSTGADTETIQNAIRGKGARGFPLYDGHGLHLINRDGRYHWRLKYTRPDGRENRLALGHSSEPALSAQIESGMSRTHA